MNEPTHSEIQRYRFTTDAYHRMLEAGILNEDARVELIEGELITMSPIGMKHQSVVDRFNQVFVTQVAGLAIVRVQGSIVLSESSEPRPDLVLLSPRDDFYATCQAQAADVLLAIEVSHTAIDYDRNVKMPLYAKHGIPEVWLIDIEARRVEVYLEPSENGYRQVQSFEHDTIAPRQALSILIDVAEILG